MLRNILKDKIYDYLKETGLVKDLGLSNKYRVKFLAQGEYNINYTIEDGISKYVFRVNTGSQIDVESQIRYEYNGIKRLEVSGVTPKAYFVDDSKDYLEYGLLIMEFLEGKPLNYSTDLNRAANIFSKIHSIDLKDTDFNIFIEEKEVLRDRIKEGKKLLKDFLASPIVSCELKNFFYKFLQWAEDNKANERYFKENKWQVINNTEVNSHNFIIGQEKSYLIDWEKPVISDPCQDITQFLADTTTLWKTDYILSKDEKENFFRNYEREVKSNYKDIRERVNIYTPYLYLRALAWCAYAWLEYRNPEKDIKNQDTLNKIENYLQLDFMKRLLSDWF
ncbi:aminoglycoside phosphotransferase family protein [Clostridium sp. CX1]|uniref:aminoglycoside phosphotransferase family protein n=1 Tax=Clostridium sp. CX1 TaxID=2978346 RepID=UPI0021BF46EA|nr:aminoglycoside phosphotransferase family protein [Clostridium sp. CX1]MCT8977638.1 aminoglycoside phosphotransferase family protein [Clostridium sp. CX1]